MWLPEDMDAAIEYMGYLSALCAGCGLPIAETLDPSNRYKAEPWQCGGCAARDEESRHAQEVRSEYAAAAFDGIKYAVTKVS